MSDPQANPAAIATLAGRQQVWNETARDWDEEQATLGPSMQPISDRLIALAHVTTGQRVLDVATGAGDPALTAARIVGLSGSVVGVDHAPQMLEMARQRATAAGLGNVTFIEGDAQRLDLPPASFDAVLSRWGLMFFLPLVPALEELRRVLRPGGYLAAAVWGAPQEVPLISASVGAVFGQLGIPLPPPDQPGPFNLADAGKLARSLADAGFRNVETEPQTMSVTFPSSDAFVRNQHASNMLVKTVIGQQPEDQQAALWQTVAQVGARMAGPDGSITLHNHCICISGQA